MSNPYTDEPTDDELFDIACREAPEPSEYDEDLFDDELVDEDDSDDFDDAADADPDNPNSDA